jgi:hypothetical protein
MTDVKDLVRGARILCECSDGSEYVTFNHIDGMYALCTTEMGGLANIYIFQQLELTSENTYPLSEKAKSV